LEIFFSHDRSEAPFRCLAIDLINVSQKLFLAAVQELGSVNGLRRDLAEYSGSPVSGTKFEAEYANQRFDAARMQGHAD
jgi:hypothetical protein